MQNIIADIGKMVLAAPGSDIIQFLIPDSCSFKNIIKMNFDLDGQELGWDLYKDTTQEHFTKDVLQEILYIPPQKGARPQYLATSGNMSYLITQTLTNMHKMLPEGELKNQIQSVLETFFIATDKPTDARYGKILHDRYCRTLGVQFNRNNNSELKKDAQAFAEELQKAVTNKFGTKTKETMYTIAINDRPIAHHPAYIPLLLKAYIEDAFENAMTGKCSICGETREVTQDTTRFEFKFYMVDKINFASYFDKNNFYKAVSLCGDCYKNLMVGEKWIEKNMKTRLGGFGLYLIPQFFSIDRESGRLVRHLEKLPAEFNEVKNIKELHKNENQIIDYFENSPFILNFLFYRKAQSAFKVMMMIKDVPPTRILELYRVTNEIGDLSQSLFNDKVKFHLDQIFWIVPIKKSGADLLEYRKILQIYYNIFNEIRFESQYLYEIYTQLAHMHRFESYYLYQIKKPFSPDWALMSDTLKWNLFLLFLKKLKLLNGGHSMDTTQFESYYPNGLGEVFKTLDYNLAQQGLALLGYVLGAVATAQYKEGLDNKPVLEKVNYQGITEEKVIRLFNELFEKIRQYKRHIGFAERWWAAARQCYESGDPGDMTSDERVFYLLSGYSMHLLQIGRDTDPAEAEPEAEQVEEILN